MRLSRVSKTIVENKDEHTAALMLPSLLELHQTRGQVLCAAAAYLPPTSTKNEYVCFIIHQLLLLSSIMFKTAFLLGYLKGKNGNQQEDVFFKKMRMFVRLGLSCPMGTLTLEPGPKSAPQRDISKSQICHQILPHNTFPFSSEICHF